MDVPSNMLSMMLCALRQVFLRSCTSYWQVANTKMLSTRIEDVVSAWKRIPNICGLYRNNPYLEIKQEVHIHNTN